MRQIEIDIVCRILSVDIHCARATRDRSRSTTSIDLLPSAPLFTNSGGNDPCCVQTQSPCWVAPKKMLSWSKSKDLVSITVDSANTYPMLQVLSKSRGEANTGTNKGLKTVEQAESKGLVESLERYEA